MTNARKVKWLIAHEPQELFIRTAKAFSEELNKYIPGQIEIEIITVPEYIAQHEELAVLKTLSEGDIPQRKLAVDALFTALETDIDLSQTQTHVIGSKSPIFHILDLPFLFDDHAQVSRVLEGQIGQDLCDNLESRSNVKGLAFTYSGGYRVIGSNHKIEDLKELSEQKVIVVSEGPKAKTMEAIGAEPIVVSPHLWAGYDNVYDSNDATAIETTYLRFKGTHILKTNHSMFMTTILSSKSFWNSLTEEQQSAFEQVAKIVARIEREWAIEEAAEYERNFKENGVEITNMTSEDQSEMRSMSQAVYDHYKDDCGWWIDRIRKS